jgi:arsenate reductase
VVVTVCDAANDVCPVYPAKTRRLHVSFPDPSGQSLEGWRRVRDALGEMSRALVEQLRQSGKSLEAASLASQGLASRAFEGLVTGSERSMVMLEEKGQEGKRQEAAAHKTKVLFICTGNTARSQMAEAFLRHDGGDGFRAYSAGLRPSEINPYTLRVMEEAGIDMSRHHAKGVKTYLGRDRFDYVVTVCAKAEENCPTNFIGTLTKLHWPFEDPAVFEGSDKDKLVKFRAVRDQIRAQIQAWLKGELDLRSGIPLEDVPQS